MEATTYQYDTENRLAAVYDKQKLLMAAGYDGDGNRTFQLNYNPDAVCGYGKNMSGEVFMPENSTDEDGNETAEGYLFGKVCSKTGRSYDLTEYVNDTNREYTQVLSADVVNSGATESYSYAGNQRLSRNNIWNEARGVDHNETSYYLYDGRGSVTANTWYNGMVTNAYQYDPYGEVTLGSADHEDFYGYNAESYNPNTGLEYLRARYYNADMGRFFQEDTYLGKITDPLTLNRYAYTKNSPMNYIDPSGHLAMSDSNNPASPNFKPTPSNGSNDNAFKVIASAIERNFGALTGAAAGVAIVMLTAGAAAPVLAVIGAGMAGGAVGLMSGGALQKGTNSADVARELQTKYGINVGEYQDIEVSTLPKEAQSLCAQYEEDVEDMETYLEAGTVAGAAGIAIYEAGLLLDSIGAKVVDSSKRAFETVKNWFKGESGAGTSYNSFNEFKKANPVQTQGNQWHHIVEQNQVSKSGFSVQQINNTNNLIELTPSQHSQISGYYSSKPSFTNGLTVRNWLAGQSYEAQYQFGMDYMKQLGIIK